MHLLQNHVVLSGCSGGGKSPLLVELARRGHAVVPARAPDRREGSSRKRADVALG